MVSRMTESCTISTLSSIQSISTTTFSRFKLLIQKNEVQLLVHKYPASPCTCGSYKYEDEDDDGRSISKESLKNDASINVDLQRLNWREAYANYCIFLHCFQIWTFPCLLPIIQKPSTKNQNWDTILPHHNGRNFIFKNF